MPGYWVFANGGLFDSRAVESPPLYHVVNLPGQNQALDGGTLCGWQRFKPECAGGAWRPEATGDVERGSADIGGGSDHPQVCPRCADALIHLFTNGMDWDELKEWARGRSPLARPRRAVAA
jgi:hypothetical protein